MALITPGSVLVKAQEASLSHDDRVDTLILDAVEKGVPDLQVADSLTRAKVTLTIEGASTLEIDIEDPDWLIEQSGFLDIDGNGRMNAVSVKVDGLEFRLVKASRSSPDTLTLTFEDIVFSLLREHNKHKAASRGKVTRAQFIELLVKEVKARRIPYFSPQKIVRQPVAYPDYPTTKPAAGDTGFDDNTKLNLKQWDGSTHLLDGDQMRNAAAAMGVADQENASPKATLALLEACIVEAPMFSNPVGGEGTSSGILQLTNDKLGGSTSTKGGRRDVEKVCREFLKGTGSYAGHGGAMPLAREHPDWTAGQIAQRCQGSAHGGRYDQVHDSAKKVADAYSGGATGSTSDSVVRVKKYQFTRGLPGKKENSVEAATRLAQEVQWRFFAVGGVVVFRFDDDILGDKASLVIGGITDTGLLQAPTYDWDHGKIATEVRLQCAADRWGVVPGGVVVLEHMGPISGRWICETFEFDLFDSTACDVTLTKAMPKRKEPAPEVVTVDSNQRSSATDSSSQKSGTGKVVVAAGANRPGASLTSDIMDYLERAAAIYGKPLVVSTGTNHSQYTTSGNISDHWSGNAADLGMAANHGTDLGPVGDAICSAALQAGGVSRAEADAAGKKRGAAGFHQFHYGKFRVQVLWGFNDPALGGNHLNHVHVGVKRE